LREEFLVGPWGAILLLGNRASDGVNESLIS